MLEKIMKNILTFHLINDNLGKIKMKGVVVYENGTGA